MKKAIGLKLDIEIIDMVNEIAKQKNWSKNSVVEEAIKQFFYKNQDNSKTTKSKTISKIGDKHFKFIFEEVLEFGEAGEVSIAVSKVYADEDIKYQEFDYKKGDLVLDSEKESWMKSIFKYQNIDVIPD